jgi:hypothetical protein
MTSASKAAATNAGAARAVTLYALRTFRRSSNWSISAG